ncbi:hypothetical protein SAMN05192550_1647 [Flavobacterium glycines]|uniref:Lipoprotein n=2 Tax=Flavobacterium glycines TaxID=551990 RepID=A0A1G8QYR7_9FLAO|nr:hypothetical protein SAMN05192550_1647 [Flavobacterium glycines]
MYKSNVFEIDLNYFMVNKLFRTQNMTKLKTLIFFLTVALFSCNKEKTTFPTDKNKTKNSVLKTIIPINISKSTSNLNATNVIVVDDYTVTNEMLTDKTRDNSSYKRKSGEIFSLDKVWFTNDTLKQTLIFELYTDYHRLYIYHLINNDIPSDLIKQIELSVSKSKIDNIFETATLKQKQTYFSGFINSAIKINQNYFTSKKGFRLGDKKEKAISIYGIPDKCSTIENIEKCEWKYEGDYVESEETHPKEKTNKPFAKNSFGYSVIMYFRSNNLIAMIISNDIP